MSEAFDKVSELQELPLFPLPLVLFPGVPLPLHIFEPRYRQLLMDVRGRDNLFGVSYFEPDGAIADRPPVGHVGCVAEVIEAQPQADGRSNILTIGLIRYLVESYVETEEPYLIARVAFFEDEAEDESVLREHASEVSTLFMRIARAVRSLNDERASLPELPDAEPERLSFLITATMDIDTQMRLELLELRSTSERLRRVGDLLAQVVKGYEERARVHGVAKGNGYSGKKLNL